MFECENVVNGQEIGRLAFKSVFIVVTLSTLWGIANSAFSRPVRKAIGRRDQWKCQWEDEPCNRRFQDGYMVHAAHYDHDKSNPGYDSIEAGRILCVEHHLQDHLQAGVGLTKRENDWAINRLREASRYTRK